MKFFKDPRWLLTLIISLTLITAELNHLYPLTLKERVQQGKPANILLIGVDARPGEVHARSDTIILLSLNKPINKIAVVSIPRDTRIVYKGANRKINMINQLKGPETLCKEIGKLLNTEIDYYMAANFAGFQEMIDAIGGVYMDVDIRLHSNLSGVFLEKGYQRLSGKEALQYVRFRTNPDMDIGRISRQQKLLTALANQLLQRENLSRLPQLIAIIDECITTNISFKDMMYLGNIGRQMKKENIITQTLPGYHYFSETGTSFWEVDRQIASSLLDGLFNGHQWEVEQPAPPGANSW